MSSRRGEVPFVAMRVGRSTDPREVEGLADDLKIERATALGYVNLYEEFILEVGDAMTGRIVGYGIKHLARKLGWSGSARRLADAFKEAGLLRLQRTTIVHPYWRESITGQYARQRAEQREADRLRKRRARNRGADPSGDVTRTSGGQSVASDGLPAESSGNPEINQPTNGARGAPGASPPPDPPVPGGSKGAARWEWMQQNHRRPMNSRACVRYLDAMPDEHWELCQWVVAMPARGLGNSSSRKKRVLSLDSHKLLATEAYLQFLPEWRDKQRVDAQPRQKPAASNVQRVSAEDERFTRAIAFALAQLADSELSDAKKTEVKARLVKEWPGRPMPWHKPEGAEREDDAA